MQRKLRAKYLFDDESVARQSSEPPRCSGRSNREPTRRSGLPELRVRPPPRAFVSTRCLPLSPPALQKKRATRPLTFLHGEARPCFDRRPKPAVRRSETA